MEQMEGQLEKLGLAELQHLDTAMDRVGCEIPSHEEQDHIPSPNMQPPSPIPPTSPGPPQGQANQPRARKTARGMKKCSVALSRDTELDRRALEPRQNVSGRSAPQRNEPNQDNHGIIEQQQSPQGSGSHKQVSNVACARRSSSSSDEVNQVRLYRIPHRRRVGRLEETVGSEAEEEEAGPSHRLNNPGPNRNRRPLQRQEPRNGPPYRCSFCSYSNNQFWLVRTHEDLVHRRVEEVQCELCGE